MFIMVVWIIGVVSYWVIFNWEEGGGYVLMLLFLCRFLMFFCFVFVFDEGLVLGVCCGGLCDVYCLWFV